MPSDQASLVFKIKTKSCLLPPRSLLVLLASFSIVCKRSGGHKEALGKHTNDSANDAKNHLGCRLVSATAWGLFVAAGIIFPAPTGHRISVLTTQLEDSRILIFRLDWDLTNTTPWYGLLRTLRHTGLTTRA
jgi:hypothetical protein